MRRCTPECSSIKRIGVRPRRRGPWFSPAGRFIAKTWCPLCCPLYSRAVSHFSADTRSLWNLALYYWEVSHLSADTRSLWHRTLYTRAASYFLGSCFLSSHSLGGNQGVRSSVGAVLVCRRLRCWRRGAAKRGELLCSTSSRLASHCCRHLQEGSSGRLTGEGCSSTRCLFCAIVSSSLLC